MMSYLNGQEGLRGLRENVCGKSTNACETKKKNQGEASAYLIHDLTPFKVDSNESTLAQILSISHNKDPASLKKRGLINAPRHSPPLPHADGFNFVTSCFKSKNKGICKTIFHRLFLVHSLVEIR
jgi:hypothetical protein